jgi:bifunctional DNA-binding transcriptional regulator/antitoxin component of YhaV-PrlF toxin-antitoxin module
MSQRHTFTAVIQAASGGGAYAEVPFDVEEVFGDKRPQVKATMEGETFVWRLIRQGTPSHVIGVPRGIREKSGKNIGDSIEITVEADNTVRELILPPDLEEALVLDAVAKDFFDGLSYTHRKEYVRWIDAAKKPEARARRMVKMMGMLKDKKTGVNG